MTQLIEAGLVCRNGVGKYTETNDGDQPVCTTHAAKPIISLLNITCLAYHISQFNPGVDLKVALD